MCWTRAERTVLWNRQCETKWDCCIGWIHPYFLSLFRWPYPSPGVIEAYLPLVLATPTAGTGFLLVDFAKTHGKLSTVLAKYMSLSRNQTSKAFLKDTPQHFCPSYLRTFSFLWKWKFPRFSKYVFCFCLMLTFRDLDMLLRLIPIS